MSRYFEELVDTLPLGSHDKKRLRLDAARLVETAKRETQHRLHMVAEERDGPTRLEAVEFEGKITFTMAYNSDVMCHVGEDSATKFCRFLHKTMEEEGRPVYERFCLASDEDAHWYIIPADKKSEWEQLNFDEDVLDQVDWARRLSGRPNSVTFIDAQISS